MKKKPLFLILTLILTFALNSIAFAGDEPHPPYGSPPKTPPPIETGE